MEASVTGTQVGRRRFHLPSSQSWLLDSIATTIIGPVVPALLNALTGDAIAQMSTVFGAITVISRALIYRTSF